MNNWQSIKEGIFTVFENDKWQIFPEDFSKNKQFTLWIIFFICNLNINRKDIVKAHMWPALGLEESPGGIIQNKNSSGKYRIWKYSKLLFHF